MWGLGRTAGPSPQERGGTPKPLAPHVLSYLLSWWTITGATDSTVAVTVLWTWFCLQ